MPTYLDSGPIDGEALAVPGRRGQVVEHLADAQLELALLLVGHPL